jgi:1,2-dihydroxy-3-keto-5-methylthiopentene dioxygenase
MSVLSVYHVSSPEQPYKVLTHLEDIVSTLAEQGVTFERLRADTPLTAGISEDDVIKACRAQIDTLMAERGHVTLEVISVGNHHPQRAEVRAGFLEERQHGADEVRFFVAGQGLLNLHIGDFVYAVLCERHDLISLPAGTRHWLDMGEFPQLVAIRLFNAPDGQTATFTGDDIAARFPGLDD